MAHPVRPDSYLEINNFYTVTIYEKGAEVVRMMQTLVGRQGFAKGMQLYFQRHDGQAVTCDDFVQAIAEANPSSSLNQHLDVFKRWYSQAGTPQVTVMLSHDATTQQLHLHLTQRCAPTPGQPSKQPFLIPVQMALLDASGQEMLPERLLVLHEAEQTFVIEGVPTAPIPSLLRGFSAPVQLHCELQASQRLVLMAHDTDPFNRWEAAQTLFCQAALDALAHPHPEQPVLPMEWVQGLRQVLRNPNLDPAFKELVLTLPSETFIAEQLDQVDPQRIHQVRERMRQIGRAHV